MEKAKSSQRLSRGKMRAMSSDHSDGIVLHSNGEDFAVETAPGKFVPKIDPVTMKPTGEAQRFTFAEAVDARAAEAAYRDALAMDEARKTGVLGR